MADITPYLRSAAVGTKVASRTGSAADGFKAGGYAAFVDSVTGSAPSVVDRPDGGVSIVQTPTQNKILGNWAENQLLDSFFKRKPAGKVSYGIGPAFTPVAVKYAIPVTAVIFAAGFIMGRMLQ
jgi:hypothetical protein